ncbi:hypothetical protein OPV22_035063 [Ensete ventricosum]|uniref:Uncharacterized protein n=1 Tax=Ensete ventricosum TaxID=4639 RepID=A0AAV8PKD7_ENSVE|nr:hypothetical protein OPV22_035063 [Ensete ventricosum]
MRRREAEVGARFPSFSRLCLGKHDEDRNCFPNRSRKYDLFLLSLPYKLIRSGSQQQQQQQQRRNPATNLHRWWRESSVSVARRLETPAERKYKQRRFKGLCSVIRRRAYHRFWIDVLSAKGNYLTVHPSICTGICKASVLLAVGI